MCFTIETLKLLSHDCKLIIQCSDEDKILCLQSELRKKSFVYHLVPAQISWSIIKGNRKKDTNWCNQQIRSRLFGFLFPPWRIETEIENHNSGRKCIKNNFPKFLRSWKLKKKTIIFIFLCAIRFAFQMIIKSNKNILWLFE